MLNQISSMVRCESPVASVLFYSGVTLFAGRKFCLAAGYTLGGKFAQLIGKTNVDEWNKAADVSYKMAKKDVLRDVTAVVGIIAVAGLALKSKNSIPEVVAPVPPTFTEKVKDGAKSLLKAAAVVVPPTVIVGGIWSAHMSAQRLSPGTHGIHGKI